MHQPLAFVLLLVGGVPFTGIVLSTSSSLFGYYVLETIRRILRLSKKNLQTEVRPNIAPAMREPGFAETMGAKATEAWLRGWLITMAGKHTLEIGELATILNSLNYSSDSEWHDSLERDLNNLVPNDKGSIDIYVASPASGGSKSFVMTLFVTEN